MKGILIFNKHLLFLLTVIVLFVSLLVFYFLRFFASKTVLFLNGTLSMGDISFLNLRQRRDNTINYVKKRSLHNGGYYIRIFTNTNDIHKSGFGVNNARAILCYDY